MPFSPSNPPRSHRISPRLYHRFTPYLAMAALLFASQPSYLLAKTSIANLKQNFQNPPNATKPMVRWWWFGTAVEKSEILRELHQMKADGIGGAEMAFVYPEVLDDPAKGLINQPFVSPDMLDNVRYAQSEGRKLGLRIDITLGSGWPYGGPATTLDEAATRLRTIEVPIPQKSKSIPYPKLGKGESEIYVAIVKGDSKHWDASSSQPIPYATFEACCPPPSISFNEADSPRTAIFFIQSHTGQLVKRASVGAEGWVLDPFSHQAVATHLRTVGEPLVKAFGSTPPYAIFSDSLEAYGADWTPTLPAEFRKRRGYDLLPHLPELVAGGTPEAEKVRHDWGRTLTELVDENYLVQINDWAIAHHTKFRSQTYGEPAVSSSSERLVALPEGEGPQWRAFSTLRWATSANHVFGNNVTSGETFTWLHSPVFRATPLDMKAEADIDFITGENQLIFHGWPYSPPAGKVPEPGWSLYAAAVFNDHNPWHPVMPDVTRYIARMSYLLRQGQPANQVAILLPTDDAWAAFTPSHVTVTGAMQKLITPQLMSTILSAGYNVDFIDADAINRLGIHHQILVLPPTDRIPAETLKKISAWVATGGKVISIGHAPSILPDGKSSPELTSLSRQLFDPTKSTSVPDIAHLAEALHTASKPDIQLTGADDSTKDQIGFIRRKLPNADIYFVANTANHPIDAQATFTTTQRSGQRWDPDTGSPIAASVSPENVILHLAPYESRVFVFGTAASHDPAPEYEATKQLADLSEDWKVTFTSKSEAGSDTASAAKTEHTLTDWTAAPATTHYSGEAIYSRDFNLSIAPKTPIFLQIDGGQPVAGSPSSPAEHASLGANGLPDPRITRTGPGMRAWFDPPIREAALVTINGKPAGSLWHPPYRLDVSHLLKPGQNHIEIRVYNTALNAWSALPPHDYKPLIAKYGDRFQMQDLDKVTPVPSGILGTIRLVQQESK
jgi:hypothetical protein